MSIPVQARLTFHRNTFFELETPKRRLFIDPVFSRERRGRRVTAAVRPCDYVLATSMTPWFDDVLDVLDECEAIFVASTRLRRLVADELGLKRGRLLDLEPWERASEPGLRLTALPMTASMGMEGAIDEGAGLLRDLGNIFPVRRGRVPLLDSALPVLEGAVRNMAGMIGNLGGVLRQPRAMDRMSDMLGVDLSTVAGGRPGLAYLIEPEGAASLLHLADGVHAGTSPEDLEDMAEICQPDVLVMHAAGLAVEPYVRAARTLGPRSVLLYRSRDPYRVGARGQAIPMTSFVGALAEGAPECKVVQLRRGDSFTLERPADRPAAVRPGASKAGDAAARPAPGLGASSVKS
ncbi:MAG: MBL fold metallo-hydrolase [Deltaproteobacteria bacterium]|nr:MBL fold metallo-hydrolase [Deltaproteobacteria bacterium]